MLEPTGPQESVALTEIPRLIKLTPSQIQRIYDSTAVPENPNRPALKCVVYDPGAPASDRHCVYCQHTSHPKHFHVECQNCLRVMCLDCATHHLQMRTDLMPAEERLSTGEQTCVHKGQAQVHSDSLVKATTLAEILEPALLDKRKDREERLATSPSGVATASAGWGFPTGSPRGRNY